MAQQGKRQKHQQKDFVKEFSLFLLPFLAVLPAMIVMMFLDYRIEIISSEMRGGRVSNFSAALLVEVIWYFSFATVLGLIAYRFKVAVLTAKNYIFFTAITLFFILIWSFFKGDLDAVFSWQGIPLSFYIAGYVIVLPMYAFILFVACLIFHEALDKVIKLPVKNDRYWRLANYLPNYFLSVTLSYFLLKIGEGIDGNVSRFFVYYHGLSYLLLLVALGGIIFIASLVGDKKYHKIEFKQIFKSVLILTITLTLISAIVG